MHNPGAMSTVIFYESGIYLAACQCIRVPTVDIFLGIYVRRTTYISVQLVAVLHVVYYVKYYLEQYCTQCCHLFVG